MTTTDPILDAPLDAPEEPTAIRAARIRLMHVLEPQDSLGCVLVAALGPVRALEAITGRNRLDSQEARAVAEEFPSHASLLDTASVAAAVRRWAARSEQPVPPRLEELMASQGAWLATPEDPDWPQSLAELGVAQPLGLWGRGDRSGLGEDEGTNIAFVGSRDATGYGESVTGHLAGDLAAEGYGVLSGGAFGIDAAAHRAALATSVRGTSTVAFLACGIDRWYPRAHESLLREVAREGMVLTEMPPGASPMRHRFLQRNRLIAAMSEVTVVVEARLRSGALNTAHHALELGHTVAAVPGSVFSAQSAGCHRLLEDGLARMVTSTRDLRALLTAEPCLPGLGAGACGGSESAQKGSAASSAAVPELTEVQALVRDALPVARAVPTDRICTTAGLSAREALPALSRLESLGLAERDERACWRLRRENRSQKEGQAPRSPSDAARSSQRSGHHR